MGKRGKNQWRQQKSGRRLGEADEGDDSLPSSAYEQEDRDENRGATETAEDESGEEGGEELLSSKFHLYQKSVQVNYLVIYRKFLVALSLSEICGVLIPVA